MTLSSESTFKLAIDALGFSDNPNFVTKETPPIAFEQYKIWIEAIKTFEIDAVFFLKRNAGKTIIPFVYFKIMDKFDNNKLMTLHRNIWNQGKIPLLYVILPGQIKIYNCFEPPLTTENELFDTENRLMKYLEYLIDAEDLKRELSSYSCAKLSSGRFWKEQKDKFNFNDRADQHLLRNLQLMRNKILDEGLEDTITHKLIGRCIFILCLQDRGALDNFLKNFKNGLYSKFTDILRNKEDTYAFYNFINTHFNGDIYPITNEEIQKVNDKHLILIRHWLEGTDLETGQTILWPYRFNIIPIEFISNIYEEFFHYEQKITLPGKSKSVDKWVGTYYTPQYLVDFMLEEMISIKDKNYNVKILDPACGSGIFLVESYRKLIEMWKVKNKKNTVEIKILKNILKNSIFGVDINKEAINISAFNLYLTMIDYIEPENIWHNKGLFPKLVNSNLYPIDYFDNFSAFNYMKFDIIIGNVPWKSVSKESGQKVLSYCRYNNKIIGDHQISQAFLWKSLDLCKDNGEICILTSAKSLLFNRSEKNKQFRIQLFKNINIKTIINLSILRHQLFNKSVGPASIILFKKKNTVIIEDPKPILYIVPKPSWEIKYLGAIILDQSDYKRIPYDLALEEDTIWKIAMWGTPRDYDLIKKGISFGTLKSQILQKGWEMGDGFQKAGGDQNYAPWMVKIPIIPTRRLTRFFIPKEHLENNIDTIFHRPRKKNRYIAPICLVKVTLKDGLIVSAFSDTNVAYTDGIIGISGRDEDNDALKILCCYFNSNVARYFLFLTASVWGVERDDILKSDLLNIPVIIPDKRSPEYNDIISLYDEMVSSLNTNKLLESSIVMNKINSIFYKLFNLNDIEMNLIIDTVNYTIDYFQKRDRSQANDSVNNKLLMEYAEHSLSLLNATIISSKKSFNSKIYSGSNELKIVSYILETNLNKSSVTVIENNNELNNILDKLSNYLKEQGYVNIYLQRIVRIYDGNTIYLIKPNEKKYWTKITAFKDTDDTIAELLETWRGEQLL